jgi:hypothetical protein
VGDGAKMRIAAPNATRPIDKICYYWHIMTTGTRKPLFWIGSTRRDLKEFPDDVQDMMGHALDIAQR